MSSEDKVIVASSQADQKSKEVNLLHAMNTSPHPHGAFTYYLLEGMDGKAADEKTGIITLDRLYSTNKTYVADSNYIHVIDEKNGYNITNVQKPSNETVESKEANPTTNIIYAATSGRIMLINGSTNHIFSSLPIHTNF